MRRSQKTLTLLRIQFESANQKKKILAVTRATRDVIEKQPRSSGVENGTLIDRRGFRRFVDCSRVYRLLNRYLTR